MSDIDKILTGAPADMTEPELLATLREGMAANKIKIEETQKARKSKRRVHAQPDPLLWEAQLQNLIEAKPEGGIVIGMWRVSTVGQEENGYSSEVQKQSIIAWVVTNTKRAVVDIWIYDVDSGAESNRPGLNFLRRAMETNAISYVVFYKHDRLVRDQLQAEQLHRSGKSHGCKLISATENLGQGYQNVMYRQVVQAFAQFERALIKERMKRGKHQAVTVNGLYPGPVAPYGYAIQNGRLVLAEAEAAVVRLIFQLHFRGYNIVAIAQFLNENDVATRTDSPVGWRTVTIFRIIAMQGAFRAEEVFGVVFKGAAVNVFQPAILPYRDPSERSPVIVKKLPKGTRIPQNFLSDDPIVPRLLGGKPEKANTILLAIYWKGSGLTYQAVANRLNSLQLTTPLNRTWSGIRVSQYWIQKEIWIAAAAAAGVTKAVMPVSLGEVDAAAPAGVEKND